METLQSLGHALSERRQDRRARAAERDRTRGYSIDKKRVVLAYLSEIVIVVASLYGAWMFANIYGHNENREITMMMLAPIAYAVVEFCRVPLAISARAHSSRLIRMVAFVCVIGAACVTVKSMSQLGEIMFRPRLFDVVRAEETLRVAKRNQTTTTEQIAVAERAVADRKALFQDIEGRAKTDAQFLAGLPKDQCTQTAGTTQDGRAWKGQKCTPDSRIPALKQNLAMTIAARDEALKRLEVAVKAREPLSIEKADQSVAAAEVAHREAVLHSQLHSFTGMVFGRSPTEVTDEEIHLFLRIFVFVPAVFVSLASTAIAFTSVRRIKTPKPKEFVEFDPAGTEFLLNPLWQEYVEQTRADVRNSVTVSASEEPLVRAHAGVNRS